MSSSGQTCCRCGRSSYPTLAQPAWTRQVTSEHGADVAFRAHVAWYSRRPWRASVGPLSTDGQVQLAFAEADVLAGMLAVGPGRDRDLYAAGLTVSEGRVADRLVARSGDPRQRPLLREIFGVTDGELDARLADAYAGLTAGGTMTSFDDRCLERRPDSKRVAGSEM